MNQKHVTENILTKYTNRLMTVSYDYHSSFLNVLLNTIHCKQYLLLKMLRNHMEKYNKVLMSFI